MLGSRTTCAASAAAERERLATATSQCATGAATRAHHLWHGLQGDRAHLGDVRRGARGEAAQRHDVRCA
eukprot:926678-Prymnesium_polylepis.1